MQGLVRTLPPSGTSSSLQYSVYANIYVQLPKSSELLNRLYCVLHIPIFVLIFGYCLNLV